MRVGVVGLLWFSDCVLDLLPVLGNDFVVWIVLWIIAWILGFGSSSLWFWMGCCVSWNERWCGSVGGGGIECQVGGLPPLAIMWGGGGVIQKNSIYNHTPCKRVMVFAALVHFFVLASSVRNSQPTRLRTGILSDDVSRVGEEEA